LKGLSELKFHDFVLHFAEQIGCLLTVNNNPPCLDDVNFLAACSAEISAQAEFKKVFRPTINHESRSGER